MDLSSGTYPSNLLGVLDEATLIQWVEWRSVIKTLLFILYINNHAAVLTNILHLCR